MKCLRSLKPWTVSLLDGFNHIKILLYWFAIFVVISVLRVWPMYIYPIILIRITILHYNGSFYWSTLQLSRLRNLHQVTSFPPLMRRTLNSSALIGCPLHLAYYHLVTSYFPLLLLHVGDNHALQHHHHHHWHSTHISVAISRTRTNLLHSQLKMLISCPHLRKFTPFVITLTMRTLHIYCSVPPHQNQSHITFPKTFIYCMITNFPMPTHQECQKVIWGYHLIFPHYEWIPSFWDLYPLNVWLIWRDFRSHDGS